MLEYFYWLNRVFENISVLSDILGFYEMHYELYQSEVYWLIIYGFTFRSRIFHLHGDVTITGEGLQNFGLCSALKVVKQGGIFIVPHLLWHGTSVFPVSSEGPPHSVDSYDARGGVEDLI
jgi:hypothetical protein